ncbi:hypothetical protein HK102_003491 [Quaeritorhiza haematococci]|nr:hypothetical protein HK102_003491 [Quaeritorhiza haematococci]
MAALKSVLAVVEIAHDDGQPAMLDIVAENLLKAWSTALPHLRRYVFVSMTDLVVDTVLAGKLMENAKLLQILLEAFGFYEKGDADSRDVLVEGLKCIHALVATSGDASRLIAAKWYPQPLLGIVQREGADEDLRDEVVTQAVPKL